MNKPINLQELKRKVGMSPYPVQDIKQKVRCFNAPKHTNGDQTPSLSFYERDGEIRWHCHPCNIDGDVIDYLERTEDINKAEAIKRLQEITHNRSEPVQQRQNSKTFKKLTIEQIKAIEPKPGYKYIRHHAYESGQPPYIKAIYRRDSDEDKTGLFFTIEGNNQYQAKRESKPVLYNQAALQERPSDIVFYPEGEKDCDTLTGLGLLSVTAGGANDFSDKTKEHLAKYFRGRDVVLLPDNDNPGRACMQNISKLLFGIAASIKIVELPGLPVKSDVTDWIQAGHSREELLELVREAQAITQEVIASHQIDDKPAVIRIVSIRDFLSLKLSPRQMLLSPWLPSQGLCMVYGYRGTGKTFILLGIAVALSSGGTFLRWETTEPQRVLYIDGEMPAITMQERLASVIRSADKEPLENHLHIITPDLQHHGIPDLATPEGQKIIDPYAEQANVVILDNISTLCRTGGESKGDDWGPVQSWALNLRRKGVSVVFVHHEGKNGFQRGTSKREDVLDTVIKLKRPGDYEPSEGLRVEVHFEKSRGIFGDDVKPFETRLISDSVSSRWDIKDLEQSLTERVAENLNDGIPQHELAELLGVAKGTISKHKRKAQELGMLRVSR